MSNYTWTGSAKRIEIWGERMAEVGSLRPRRRFELFNNRWEVERQARRTTFARCVIGQLDGCRIQLKKSKRVTISYVVARAP